MKKIFKEVSAVDLTKHYVAHSILAVRDFFKPLKRNQGNIVVTIHDASSLLNAEEKGIYNVRDEVISGLNHYTKHKKNISLVFNTKTKKDQEKLKEKLNSFGLAKVKFIKELKKRNDYWRNQLF